MTIALKKHIKPVKYCHNSPFMDDYKTVRIKRKTLTRFKRFSKKVSKSYSLTLEIVMNFFEWHGFLPTDKFGKSMVEEIMKNRKRTEATIAILRDIEKNQTKPTNAMLFSLFQENTSKDETKLLEVKKVKEPLPPSGGTTVPKIQYDKVDQKLKNITNEFIDLLDKVKVSKSSFGKTFLKLEITEAEFVKIKRNINK